MATSRSVSMVESFARPLVIGYLASDYRILPDGSLVFTIGDRGDRDRAQSLREHAGKSLRLRDDGAVPPDNPFIGASGALPEIYSTGHRNAQGLAVQPQTGWLWLHEHGPRGGDELNVVEAGRNYGWPLITYGQEYAGGRIGVGTAAAGLEQPVQYWVPSIAPSGMAFYSGEAFPGWQGNLFVGALVGQHLRRLVIEGRRVVHQEVLLQDSIGRIRDVRQGPDGLLYLLTDERDGALFFEHGKDLSARFASEGLKRTASVYFDTVEDLEDGQTGFSIVVEAPLPRSGGR